APITPLIGRLKLTLFGTSLIGFRVFSAIAVSMVMVLAGLIARELGGEMARLNALLEMKPGMAVAEVGAGKGQATVDHGQDRRPPRRLEPLLWKEQPSAEAFARDWSGTCAGSLPPPDRSRPRVE